MGTTLAQSDGMPPDTWTEFSKEPNQQSFLYSSRSLWYPQAVVSDYATARIRLAVPVAYEAVASGELEGARSEAARGRRRCGGRSGRAGELGRCICAPRP